MFRKLLLCILISCCILLTSCLKQFCTITFKSDLSGTYTIRNKINIDSVSQIAYYASKAMDRKRFKNVNIEQFKLIFSAQLSGIDLEKQKGDLEAKLPKGVKLVELKKNQEKEDGKDVFIIDMKFSFANIDALKKMNQLDISAMQIIKQQAAQMGKRIPGSIMKDQGLPFQLEIDQSSKEVSFEEKGDARYKKQELDSLAPIIPGLTKLVEPGYSRLSVKVPKKYSVTENNAYKTKKTKYYWRKGLIVKDSDEKMSLTLKKK